MVSRKKHIIQELKRCKLDFKFYSEFCDILNLYNDLENYFKVKMNDFGLTILILDIAYTITQNIDIDSLLHMYPIYLKEHVHFYIFSQKFRFFEINFFRYFENDIIQKNEWEENFFEYIMGQISFLKTGSKYYLDSRELSNIVKEHCLNEDLILNYIDKSDINKYFEVYSKKISAEHIFHKLFLFIEEEVLNGL
ncbi:hypothetical protein [Streptococcus sp. NLN76]|uniref:hypothetical protein n=1 Tax=Streptococcus sp. NLN76 TaxID=2822800 RepID=UPI0018AAC413|nr:hypothetical protein [Streptococcus sp. NLN76]MBF8971150.1 hypothetical protein [Streptococcus sp. NLN76]